MRKTPSLYATLPFVALLFVSSNANGQQKKQSHETAYQSALQSYSDKLKPGMTRKSVEDYLRTKGFAFTKICCVGEKSAFADLVKVGEEKHPWYCDAHNVYIAFQFSAVDPEGNRPSENDSDVLKNISVFHKLEGCL